MTLTLVTDSVSALVDCFTLSSSVWRIFSGAHLQVVKLSNQKLMAGTLAVLLLDLIFVAVWQGLAPLVPIEYSRIVGDEQHVYNHCSVQSSAGEVFVILVAIEKVGLLLFGAVMAFNTVSQQQRA